MRKVVLGVILAGSYLALPAYGLEVSEAIVGKYVEMKLPKAVAGVQLLAPKVKLQNDDAKLCAIARPKLIPKDIDFCLTLTPKWRQETASLLASNMSLASLNAVGVSDKYLENARNILNQGVLPALEGIEIYKADNLIGKRISNIQIKPGKLDLIF